MQTIQHERKLLLKVEEAGALLSMGRAKAYQMAATGELPGIVRVGRTIRVSAEALNDWVRKQAGAGNVAA